MLKTAALAALVLLDDFKPKAESRAEKYITDRVPMPPLLQVVRDEDDTDVFPAIPKVVTPRKPRRKHVCTWTDRDVWGACTLTFILGGFLAYLIF